MITVHNRLDNVTIIINKICIPHSFCINIKYWRDYWWRREMSILAHRQSTYIVHITLFSINFSKMCVSDDNFIRTMYLYADEMNQNINVWKLSWVLFLTPLLLSWVLRQLFNKKKGCSHTYITGYVGFAVCRVWSKASYYCKLWIPHNNWHKRIQNRKCSSCSCCVWCWRLY